MLVKKISMRSYTSYIFFLIAIVNHLSVSGQSYFRSGHVIKYSGETINGRIEVLSNRLISQKFSFIDSLSKDTIIFLPSEISEFRYENDKKYISVNIPVSKDDVQFGFAELIMDGHISLLLYEQTYYVRDQQSNVHKLETIRTEQTRDGKAYTVHFHKFRNILTTLLIDCQDVQERVPKTTLTRRSLSRLIAAYNECKGVAYTTFEAPKKALEIGIGPVIGLIRSNVNYRVDIPDFSFFTQSDFTSTSPVIGIDFNINFPRFSEYLSFHSAILSTKFSHSGNSEVIHPNYREINSITFSYSEFKIPLSIRAVVPISHHYVFLELGGVLNLLSKQESRRVERQEYFDNRIVTNDNRLFEPDGTQDGIFIGFGTELMIQNVHRIKINLRFENSSFNFYNPYEQFDRTPYVNKARNTEISYLFAYLF